jgi:hypothetical protein
LRNENCGFDPVLHQHVDFANQLLFKHYRNQKSTFPALVQGNIIEILLFCKLMSDFKWSRISPTPSEAGGLFRPVLRLTLVF